MEIGPRSGGNFVPQVINYATGFDMICASLDLFENKNILILNSQKNHAAYYVLHNDREGVLKNISLTEEIKKYIKEFHQYIQPGGKVYSFQGANAAIGVLLLLFSTQTEMDYYIANMNKFVEIEFEA